MIHLKRMLYGTILLGSLWLGFYLLYRAAYFHDMLAIGLLCIPAVYLTGAGNAHIFERK